MRQTRTHLQKLRQHLRSVRKRQLSGRFQRNRRMKFSLRKKFKAWIPAFAGMTLLLFLSPWNLQARPLLTKEVSTVGKLNFEAGTSFSKRVDEFGSPRVKYESSDFPFFAKLGIFNQTEIGFTIRR